MYDILFIGSALTISALFYWIGRSNGYTSGVNAGYDHGWIDGKRHGKHLGRRREY